MAQTYNGTLTGIQSIQVSEKAPLDVRTVVDYLSDLTTKWDGIEGDPGIQNLYTGIVVYVKETQEIYVLTGTPKNSNKPESWKKIGGGDTEGLASEEWVESQGYLKAADLPDFLTASDLDDYVKVEDLDGYLKPEDIADLAKKSDLDGFVKTEDIIDFLTASDLDDYATKRYVDKKIEDLVGGAPETLDTLKEIAEALEDNATMSKVAEAISTKANSADVYTKDQVYTKAEVDAKIDALPTEGSFPELEGSEEKEFVPGLAKVEDVIDYVADAITEATPDLSDYVKKEDIPVVPENVSAFNNDAGYLTEHQDLSDYAKKEELPVEGSFPELDGSEAEFKNGYAKVSDVVDYVADAISQATPDLTPYATKEELPTKVSELENDVPYLTEHQDLSDYAKKEELPVEGSFPELDGSEAEFEDGYAKVSDVVDYVADAIEQATPDLTPYAKKEELPINVSELNNDAGYLTEHQDLSDYAKKEELPTKVSELENDVPYLTEHQDLSDYAKYIDLIDFLTGSDLDDYVKTEVLEGYLQPEDIADLAKKSDLDGYVKVDDAVEFLTASDLDIYAKKEDVYTKAEVDVKIEDKIEEIQNEGSFPEIGGSEADFTDGFATIGGVVDYVADAIEQATPDLTPYAKKEELPTNVSDLTNDVGYLTEHQDLSDYAKKEELPVEGSFPELDGSDDSDYVPGVATVEGVIDYVAEAISQATPDLTPYATKEELPTKVSELENDVPYLTEHQDLSDYAEKDYVDVAIGSLDIPEHSEVLTTDGTQPTSGSGLSVSDNPENAFVEEVYVDDYLHAGVYYTSKGINSSKDNGGSELEDVSSITLSNGGSSWIKLNHRGTIRINIADDTLGFNLENIVGLIDDDGIEHQNPYAGHPYSPSQIIISLADGCFLKFDKDIDFTGFTETRDDESEEYIFGQTGSNYEDLDFYSVNVLPTVNAYVDGVSTRVLTEGDKIELANMIENKSSVQPISNQEILNLFI